MNQEPVVIKGTRDGISIILHHQSNFEVIKNTIFEKLQRGGGFFKGGQARLLVKDGNISQDEFEQLETILRDFGLHLRKDKPVRTIPFPSPPQPDTLILKKTLRSGQRIAYSGNVVVVGDVNPGSEIIAKGDILVFGALRGMAHAGAEGDENSIVVAFRLQPTQLRIAHVISRPPEEKSDIPQVPEMARLKDGIIIIEPYFLI
ncbi:septum site-determining protein MinC [Thermosediminibacter oceani]|uniref:Probable septum site-determining protein MinC n=1 Tax=Thermosediminibacter oceani (strain ATCC BAA-1034 / DSM 16646 / JW/IW-1228P) TaxID=555079 RepID=D9S283_THEOJ|nr:septum site-determining protein MinC [Thermosediminibacter oceani]ADL07510.1 septum site-determining protein MinC [Thermosediminibacter oceani DSM 16646]